MEEQLLKMLSQFGVTGLSVYGLWLVIKERFADMKDRIIKLETKVDECEKDREKLWVRLSESKIVTPPQA